MYPIGFRSSICIVVSLTTHLRKYLVIIVHQENTIITHHPIPPRTLPGEEREHDDEQEEC